MGSTLKSLVLKSILVAALGLTIADAAGVHAASNKKLSTKNLSHIGGKITEVGTAPPLTTSDCTLTLEGQVIAVSDDRCGASHKYCKSDKGEQCINE